MTFPATRRSLAALAAAVLALVLAPPARAAQTLHLSPAGATSVVHTTHTMIATLEEGGNGIVGARIIFSITGANAGLGGTCAPADCRTDANGQVHFSYVGQHPGTDTIHAFVDANSNGMQDAGEADVDCTAKWTCGCSVSTTTTTTTTTSTTTTTMPSNVQCYEIKNFQFPPIRNVDVVDCFGQSTVSLTRPTRLCAQATCANTVVRRAATPAAQHYTTYPSRDPSFRPVRDVTVRTPYGDLKLDVLQPDFLMVPSAAHAADTPPPALVPPLPDAYQCHLIRAARGTRRAPKIPNVVVTDEQGTYTVDLVEPRRLCAPADVSGGSPGAPDHGNFLLCWRGRTRANFGDARMTAKDAYGTLRVRLLRRLELCTPATRLP
jgi:hypothetical protein